MKQTIRLYREDYLTISKHARALKVPIAQVIKKYVDAELPKTERLARGGRKR